MSFKIFRFNCCGLDVHKTWIYACIGITDSNGRTDYKQARFSSFSKGLKELCDWLAKYNCSEVCMESTGKYWIPVFNVLEKANNSVILAHPKYTKPQKGNKTDRKDAKWICRRSRESLARCVMFWAKSRAICIRVWRRTSLQRTKSRNANRRCSL